MARLWPVDPLTMRTLPGRLVVRRDRHGRVWGSRWSPQVGGANANAFWNVDLYSKHRPWRVHLPDWPWQWTDPNP